MVDTYHETKKIKIALVFIFIFSVLVCLIVYRDASKLTNIDVDDLTETDEVDFEIENVSVGNSEMVIEGWALYPNGYINSWDMQVVLHNSEKDEYVGLPTRMSLREDVAANYPSGNHYSYSGFYAKAVTKRIISANEVYEICIIYKNNTDKFIVYTGNYVGR